MRRNYDLVERLMIFVGRSEAAKRRNIQREARREVSLAGWGREARRTHTGAIIGRPRHSGESTGMRDNEVAVILTPDWSRYDPGPIYSESSSCDTGYSGGGGSDSGGSCGGGGGSD